MHIHAYTAHIQHIIFQDEYVMMVDTAHKQSGHGLGQSSADSAVNQQTDPHVMTLGHFPSQEKSRAVTTSIAHGRSDGSRGRLQCRL